MLPGEGSIEGSDGVGRLGLADASSLTYRTGKQVLLYNTEDYFIPYPMLNPNGKEC